MPQEAWAGLVELRVLRDVIDGAGGKFCAAGSSASTYAAQIAETRCWMFGAGGETRTDYPPLEPATY